MDEKVSATDKCYRARGCLLKFRARIVKPLSGQSTCAAARPSAHAARARRSRAQKPSAILPEISVRNLPENPYRYSNRESLFE